MEIKRKLTITKINRNCCCLFRSKDYCVSFASPLLCCVLRKEVSPRSIVDVSGSHAFVCLSVIVSSTKTSSSLCEVAPPTPQCATVRKPFPISCSVPLTIYTLLPLCCDFRCRGREAWRSVDRGACRIMRSCDAKRWCDDTATRLSFPLPNLLRLLDFRKHRV